MNHHVFSTLSESCHKNQTTPTNHQVKNNNTQPVEHQNEHESVVFVTDLVCPFKIIFGTHVFEETAPARIKCLSTNRTDTQEKAFFK